MGLSRCACRINSHETAPQKTGNSPKGFFYEIRVNIILGRKKKKMEEKHEIFPNLAIIV